MHHSKCTPAETLPLPTVSAFLFVLSLLYLLLLFLAQALKRLEDSARTLKDYENLVAWYDRLDANRQRKERYRELYRSGDGIPIDYDVSDDALCFPDTLNDVLKRQERKVDFIDSIFYFPYDIYELVTDADMSIILQEPNEDHKFLLFLSALRQYSPVKIAAIRGQTDPNICKVRNAMLKKIRRMRLPKKCRHSSP